MEMELFFMILVVKKLKFSQNGNAPEEFNSGGGSAVGNNKGPQVGQNIYDGNSDSTTLTFRRLIPGNNIGLLSGSDTVMISFTGSLGSGSPSGLSGSVQFNSNSGFSGSSKVFIENSGNLFLKDTGFDPTVQPTVSGSIIYNKYRSGRRMLAQVDESRWEYTLQPFIATNRVRFWTAYGNSNTTSSLGLNSMVTGNLAPRNFAVSNMVTSLARQGFVTTTNIMALAGTRHGVQQYWFGNNARLGGFHYIVRYSISTGSQGGIVHFIGLTGSTINPIRNTNPSEMFNCVGVGSDRGDNTLSVFSGDRTNRSKIPLGSNFPVTAPFSTDLYEIRLYAQPNASKLYYSVERLNTADLIEGYITNPIPANSASLSPIIWISNGLSASATAIDIISQYLETDF